VLPLQVQVVAPGVDVAILTDPEGPVLRFVTSMPRVRDLLRPSWVVGFLRAFMVKCRFGIPTWWRVSLGFLDDEGVSRVDLARCPEVLDIVEGSGWEPVQADAVMGMIDDRSKGGD
jgi:hypothetical protein